MHIANSDKPVKFYDLDVIISVGYRVNSKRATQFRIWATGVLRKYILDGYVLDQKRLNEVREKKLEEIEKAVGLIKQTVDSKKLSGDEEKGLLRVITEYANSWFLLNKYDKNKITLPAKTAKDTFRIDYNFCILLSKTIPLPTATNGSGHFCLSCFWPGTNTCCARTEKKR